MYPTAPDAACGSCPESQMRANAKRTMPMIDGYYAQSLYMGDKAVDDYNFVHAREQPKPIDTVGPMIKESDINSYYIKTHKEKNPIINENMYEKSRLIRANDKIDYNEYNNNTNLGKIAVVPYGPKKEYTTLSGEKIQGYPDGYVRLNFLNLSVPDGMELTE